MKNQIKYLIFAMFFLSAPCYAWEEIPQPRSDSRAENKIIVKFYKDLGRARQEAQKHGCQAFSRQGEVGGVVICGRTVNSTLVLAGLEER